MASFRSLDSRMHRDVRQLHDYLWHPGWKGDPDALRSALVKDARELDALLRARGQLGKNAAALAKSLHKEASGESLFELLWDAYNLTAATEHVKKGDPKGAGEHTAWAVESMSIGVCASAGCFPIVEEWESGRIDFESYTSKLADVLQEKGVPRAGEFKRMLLAVHTFGKDWDGRAPKEAQTLAARAAIANAAWCALTTDRIRTRLGAPRKFPRKDYAAIVSRIASRL